MDRDFKFIQSFKQYIFLSPHLDDAVLSCAFLLEKLKKLKKKVRVVTVFCKASNPPYTDLAKKFMSECGYDNPEELFEVRKKEDIEVAKILNFKYLHLDFIDAACRKSMIPFFVHVYPKENQQFSGKLAFEDWLLKRKIRRSLKTLLESLSDTILLAPLGIGGHADHVMMRKIALEMNVNKLFWEDYPYNKDRRLLEKFMKNQRIKKVLDLSGNYSNKKKYISLYSSQLPSLFPNRHIPEIKERYYFSL